MLWHGVSKQFLIPPALWKATPVHYAWSGHVEHERWPLGSGRQGQLTRIEQASGRDKGAVGDSAFVQGELPPVVDGWAPVRPC